MNNDVRALGSGQRPRTRPTNGKAAIDLPQPQNDLRRTVRSWVARAVRLVFLTNLAVIVGLWVHGGGITGVYSLGTLLISLGHITGLLGAYALLIQLLLLARLPFLGWIASFDRLTAWHKVNGKITLYLILGHVGFITMGYALVAHISIPAEVMGMLRMYPGMIAAVIGTIVLILVVITSIVAVRRRLPYHTWFLIHLMAYSAVALAWFHQLPTGQDFIASPLAAAFWTSLYVATLQLIILFRFGQTIVRNLWHRLRVTEITREGSNVVSLRITGHHLDWLNARAGQFFLWRFLDSERWQEAHPYSLSAAPDGKSLRITVKDLGDFSSRIGAIKPGTPVMIEGPFGSFTDEARSRERVLLIAGGVGITPIRALLEEMSGDLTLIYRASREADLIFRDELEELAREQGITIHYVIGERRVPGNAHLMSVQHIRKLVPDVARREIYLCGPSGMMRSVRTSLQHAGVLAQHIHFDQFAF
ncbi:MAG TPA: ferredoxin reductase family protein [Chloroflexota bacterium]